MNEPQDFCWKIGGEAGYGIMVSGDMLAKTYTRGGFFAYAYAEYPSLIRGGYNTYHLRLSSAPVRATVPEINVLVALNDETVERHAKLVTDQGVLLYDSDAVRTEPSRFPSCRGKIIPVPLTKLAAEAGGETVMRNTVSLGMTVALTGWDLEKLMGVLQDAFGHKGEEVVQRNQAVAKIGYDFAKEKLLGQWNRPLRTMQNPRRMFLSGNEAIAIGALKAGCKFYAAYPMTPTSGILHYLAGKERAYSMVVKHTEDEIAAMNMVVAAGFTGVRAMTATSGGGFSLMVEALGMGGMMESPFVAVEGMRGGPSTGLPTWTSQGDLRFVLHASQDEFPRFLLSPGDVEEAFFLAHEAFNLADRFQVPTLILSDKILAENKDTLEPFATSGLRIDRGKLLSDAEAAALKDYQRYALTDDGISPRTIPGQKGGEHICTSYEHNEAGFYSEEPDNRVRMVDKRFRKVPAMLAAMPQPQLHGPREADVTLVGFGSTKGAILESMEHLAASGITANFLQIVGLAPFPAEVVTAMLQKAKRTVGIEGNKTAQLAGLIREHTGIALHHHISKYDARPFLPLELAQSIQSVLRKAT